MKMLRGSPGDSKPGNESHQRTSGTRRYGLAAKGRATSRAVSMNSLVGELIHPCFRVITPTGLRVVGSSIGNCLIDTLFARNVRLAGGTIVMKSLVMTKALRSGTVAE